MSRSSHNFPRRGPYQLELYRTADSGERILFRMGVGHLSHVPFPLEAPPWRKTFFLRGLSCHFRVRFYPATSWPLPGHFELHFGVLFRHIGHSLATSRPFSGHFLATWRLGRPPLAQVPRPLEGPRRVSLHSPGGTSHEFRFCFGSTLLRIWGPKEPTIADHHNPGFASGVQPFFSAFLNFDPPCWIPRS